MSRRRLPVGLYRMSGTTVLLRLLGLSAMVPLVVLWKLARVVFRGWGRGGPAPRA